MRLERRARLQRLDTHAHTVSGACGVQLVAPHGWGNPAGRVGPLAQPRTPSGGSWAWFTRDRSRSRFANDRDVQSLLNSSHRHGWVGVKVGWGQGVTRIPGDVSASTSPRAGGYRKSLQGTAPRRSP